VSSKRRIYLLSIYFTHIIAYLLIRFSYSHTSREALSSFLRIVGVSATLPNVSSIAAFLGANEAYAFDKSYRPVPLTTHVVGLGICNNPYVFAKSLDRHVPQLIKRFSQSKPTIVFCHTKKETETLAMELSKISGIGNPNNGSNMPLASRTNLASLQGPMLRGIAYHHAGTSRNHALSHCNAVC